MLSTDNLFKMRFEFIEMFNEIFQDGLKRLVAAAK
jgi:hypothetical protein